MGDPRKSKLPADCTNLSPWGGAGRDPCPLDRSIWGDCGGRPGILLSRPEKQIIWWLFMVIIQICKQGTAFYSFSKLWTLTAGVMLIVLVVVIVIVVVFAVITAVKVLLNGSMVLLRCAPHLCQETWSFSYWQENQAGLCLRAGTASCCLGLPAADKHNIRSQSLEKETNWTPNISTCLWALSLKSSLKRQNFVPTELNLRQKKSS